MSHGLAKKAGLFILNLLATFVGASLLASSGITWQGVLGFDMDLLPKMISTSFLGFLLLFPLPLGATAAFSGHLSDKKLAIISMGGALLGLGGAYLLFPEIQAFGLLLLFYVLSLPAVIFFAGNALEEERRFRTLRAMYGGVRKGMFVMALGVFIVGAMTIYPEQDTYVENLEEMLSPGGSVRETAADNVIANQLILIKAIKEDPRYQLLEVKATQENDDDLHKFTAFIDGLEANVRSQEHKDRLLNYEGGTDVRDILSSQFPLLDTVLEYWYIVHPILLASLLLLVSQIIIGPLGMIYGVIIEKLISII